MVKKSRAMLLTSKTDGKFCQSLFGDTCSLGATTCTWRESKKRGPNKKNHWSLNKHLRHQKMLFFVQQKCANHKLRSSKEQGLEEGTGRNECAQMGRKYAKRCIREHANSHWTESGWTDNGRIKHKAADAKFKSYATKTVKNQGRGQKFQNTLRAKLHLNNLKITKGTSLGFKILRRSLHNRIYYRTLSIKVFLFTIRLCVTHVFHTVPLLIKNEEYKIKKIATTHRRSSNEGFWSAQVSSWNAEIKIET